MAKDNAIAVVFCFISIPCAAVANCLAFQIFARLQEAGIERRWWKMEDFKLYRLYWVLAPSRGWSRRTLLAACGFFTVGAIALLIAIMFGGSS